MHELSIVQGIIELAERELKKSGASQIEEIELEIGSLAGIEPDAFDFAWEAAKANTVLENAKRSITNIQATAKCAACAMEFETQTLYDPCPHCRELFSDLIRGRELRIRALTVN